jgi:hypothetical protein
MTDPELAATPIPTSFLNRHPFTVPGIFAAVVCLIGVADLPIGYYDFLRAVVIGAGLALAMISIGAKRGWWVAASVVMIVLWSPGGEVFFHPGKAVFSGLDVALAALFVVAAATIPVIERKPNDAGKLSPYGSWWFLTLLAAAGVLLGLIFIAGRNSGIPGPND